MNQKRVLIVDDDAAIVLLLEVFFKRLEWGYQVVTVADGLAALSELQQRPFDLILTGYAMPGLTGLDLAQQARQISPDS